jgi:hypothetical protein
MLLWFAIIAGTPKPMANWPDWLVVACAILAAFVGLWILLKLFKLALWLALTAIVVVGGLVLFEWFLR